MAYELLKQCAINRIKDFYAIGFDANGDLPNPSYKQKVLSLDKNPLSASLKWLQNSGAIDDNDLEKFNRVRQCRNKLIHEMPAYVSSTLEVDIETNFTDLIELISKIETWWIVEVETDISPDNVDTSKVAPGSVIFIQILAEVALGSGDSAERFYERFQTELHKKNI